MEDNRDKSGKVINNSFRSRKGKIWFYCFAVSLLLALLSISFSLLLPALISSNYYTKNMVQLRAKAGAISNEFSGILKTVAEKKEQLSLINLPANRKDIFPVIKKIHTTPEQEGIGYYTSDLELILWLGRVIDLQSILSQESPDFLEQDTSFVVHNGTSVFLNEPGLYYFVPRISLSSPI